MVEVMPEAGPCDHPPLLQIRRIIELLPTHESPTNMTLKTLSGVMFIEEKSALVSASDDIVQS